MGKMVREKQERNVGYWRNCVRTSVGLPSSFIVYTNRLQRNVEVLSFYFRLLFLTFGNLFLGTVGFCEVLMRTWRRLERCLYLVCNLSLALRIYARKLTRPLSNDAISGTAPPFSCSLT